MNAKKLVQILVVAMLLVSSFAATGGAQAWSQCPAYYTVQWGDTLGGLALLCGSSVDAIRAANPGLGWWLYAGQVLYIPSGHSSPPGQPPSYSTYTVQTGDTLGKIAARAGTSVAKILAVNPQITNASLIYAGQVINLPSGVVVPPPSHPTQPPTQPTQPPSKDSYSIVRITFRGGLFLRAAPGGEILSSAVFNTYWYYNTGNIRRLEDGTVWVEVKLGEQIKGCWTGWMLVKDRLGNYFTSPRID
jgi:LysM repeat protein